LLVLILPTQVDLAWLTSTNTEIVCPIKMVNHPSTNWTWNTVSFTSVHVLGKTGYAAAMEQ